MQFQDVVFLVLTFKIKAISVVELFKNGVLIAFVDLLIIEDW